MIFDSTVVAGHSDAFLNHNNLITVFFPLSFSFHVSFSSDSPESQQKTARLSENHVKIRIEIFSEFHSLQLMTPSQKKKKRNKKRKKKIQRSLLTIFENLISSHESYEFEKETKKKPLKDRMMQMKSNKIRAVRIDSVLRAIEHRATNNIICM